MSTFEQRQADALFEVTAHRSAHRSEVDLWVYWTAGAGRMKWTTAPKPLLALYGELVKHMPPTKAHSAALSWFVDGLGRKPRVADGTLPEVPA